MFVFVFVVVFVFWRQQREIQQAEQTAPSTRARPCAFLYRVPRSVRAAASVLVSVVSVLVLVIIACVQRVCVRCVAQVQAVHSV